MSPLFRASSFEKFDGNAGRQEFFVDVALLADMKFTDPLPEVESGFGVSMPRRGKLLSLGPNPIYHNRVCCRFLV